MEISRTTLKSLFGLSGNICAFPGCEKRIVESDGTVIGQICHIEAAEDGGERYNPEQTDQQRAAYANLILLCKRHHEETNDVSIYTVEKLQKMKADHISNNSAAAYSVSDALLAKIESQVNAVQHNVNSGAGMIIAPQGGSVHIHGLSMSDGMALFRLLWENNMPQLQAEAKSIAEARCNQFWEIFAQKAASRGISEKEFSKFSQPDAQATLASAVKTAALKDSSITREALAALLVNRLKYDEQDIKSIVASEAISTVGKLTNNQLRILAFVFSVRYVRYAGVTSWKMLDNILKKHVMPLSDVKVTRTDLTHIEYTGCGAISIAEAKLERIITLHYPWLSFKPILNEVFNAASPAIRAVILHYGTTDGSGYYFHTDVDQDWKNSLKENGVADEIIKQIEFLYLNEDWIPLLADRSPSAAHISQIWRSLSLPHLTLTSVGMQLGIIAAELAIPEVKFDVDPWIN